MSQWGGLGFLGGSVTVDSFDPAGRSSLAPKIKMDFLKGQKTPSHFVCGHFSWKLGVGPSICLDGTQILLTESIDVQQIE